MTDNFWEQRKLQLEQEKQAEKERKAAERKEKLAQQQEASASSAIPQQQQPSQQQEKPKKKPATQSQQQQHKKKAFKKNYEQQQHNTSSNGTKVQPSSSEDPDFQTVERKTGGRRQFQRKPKKNFENGEKKKNNNNNSSSNNKEVVKKEEKPTTTETVIQPAQVKVFASPAAEASTTSAALSDWASLLKPTANVASQDATSSSGAADNSTNNKKKQDKKNVVATKKPSSSDINGTKQISSKPQKDFESGKNILRSTEVEVDQHLLDEVGVFIQPRGMTNINNSCYMNAVLQSLVSLPHFYHLMKRLGKLSLDNDEYPLTNKMARLVNEFQVMKGARSQNGEQKERKYFINASYEKLTPSYIVDYVQQSSTNLEDSFLLGTQHDAHEFLTYLLERLHEELKKTEKTLGRKSPSSTKKNKKDQQEESSEVATATDLATNVEDKWQEVGKKNKSNVIREHEMGDNSAISRIFCGKMKSFVQKQGEKGSAVVEPFFSLHLPIKDDNIKGIKFALREMTKEENVLDKNAKSTIYQLPKVLILHLRRFDFSTTEGIQKISKRIRFDYELIIDDKVVPNIKQIAGKSFLRYRLASVICHHGKEASGGHYSTFIQHGCGKWIHIDDTKITVVSLQHVLDQQAYILTYVQDDNQEHYNLYGEGSSSSPLFSIDHNDFKEKKEKREKKKDGNTKQEQKAVSPSTPTQTTTTTV
ncbi:hypothetical protein FDP41_005333 [Naegleria fowleri]|uniref:ubiquitinyl hydrolase 1 n=1 Tax=Naegleria fowleri TaxID=5763 RepID=A0A6A5BQV3_NAEFO|nr:uncharacterized protein FDP41_005333 [Naegleria fowleri]KAF0975339.1 hypothetical protein FDP41_005333 [Naegleria fowleri]